MRCDAGAARGAEDALLFQSDEEGREGGVFSEGIVVSSVVAKLIRCSSGASQSQPTVSD